MDNHLRIRVAINVPKVRRHFVLHSWSIQKKTNLSSHAHASNRYPLGTLFLRDLWWKHSSIATSFITVYSTANWRRGKSSAVMLVPTSNTLPSPTVRWIIATVKWHRGTRVKNRKMKHRTAVARKLEPMNIRRIAVHPYHSFLAFLLPPSVISSSVTYLDFRKPSNPYLSWMPSLFPTFSHGLDAKSATRSYTQYTLMRPLWYSYVESGFSLEPVEFLPSLQRVADEPSMSVFAEPPHQNRIDSVVCCSSVQHVERKIQTLQRRFLWRRGNRRVTISE